MIICKIFRLTYRIHHLKNFDLIEFHFEPLSVPCRYILVELSGNHSDSKKILEQPWSVPLVFSSLPLKCFYYFFKELKLLKMNTLSRLFQFAEQLFCFFACFSSLILSLLSKMLCTFDNSRQQGSGRRQNFLHNESKMIKNWQSIHSTVYKVSATCF